MSEQLLLETAIAFVNAHNSRQDADIVSLSSQACRHVRRLSSASSVAASASSKVRNLDEESSEVYAQKMYGLFGRLKDGAFRYHVWAIESSTVDLTGRVVVIRGFKKLMDEHGEETMRQCLSTLRMSADGNRVDFHEDVYF